MQTITRALCNISARSLSRPCVHQLRFFSEAGGGGGEDWRGRAQPPQPPPRLKTSEEVHGVLREEDVTSKAMRRKLARASPAAALQPTPDSPPVALPQQQQQQQQQKGAPSFFQYMLSNVVMGMGMTLGFIAVAAAFRAVTGIGSAPPRPPPQPSPHYRVAPVEEPPTDAYTFDLNERKQRASETRI